MGLEGPDAFSLGWTANSVLVVEMTRARLRAGGKSGCFKLLSSLSYTNSFRFRSIKTYISEKNKEWNLLRVRSDETAVSTIFILRLQNL